MSDPGAPGENTGMHDLQPDLLCSPAPTGTGQRVLVIASDRRFRAVAATLLTRRGYAVAVAERGEDIVDLARRVRAEVVVIDAGHSLTVAARQAAQLDVLRPRVGVVTVSGEAGSALAAMPVLPKWTSFDDMYAAIDRVGAAVGRGVEP
jgi:DNA-binding NtrC family response regulator